LLQCKEKKAAGETTFAKASVVKGQQAAGKIIFS